MTLDGYTEAQLLAMHQPAFQASLDANTAYLAAVRRLAKLIYPSPQYTDCRAYVDVLRAAALQAHEHFGAIHDELTARQAEADAAARAVHGAMTEAGDRCCRTCGFADCPGATTGDCPRWPANA